MVSDSMTKERRVLQIIGPINGGGVSSVVYNYLSHMDLTELRIDILAYEIDGVEEQEFDKKFKKLGCNVIYFQHRNEDYVKHFLQYKQLLEKNKYDVVHCHFGLWSGPYVYIAKQQGVAVRISHSHGAASDYNLIKELIVRGMRFLVNKYSTIRLSCGDAAGKYVYGNKQFIIVRNAIEIEKFKYDLKVRKKTRAGLSLERFVVGFVGRLSPEKNPEFVIEIAKKMNKEEFQFVIVGDGENKKKLEALIAENGLHDMVSLLGKRDDVNCLMQAMDCLIMPSYHEGFPVAAVEAQASGLPVLLSNEISDEVKISNSVIFIPINEGVKPWVREIVSSVDYKRDDRNVEPVRKAGYDITKEAQSLKSYYVGAY